MDDKETKNIDGIKAPDQSQNNPEEQVPVTVPNDVPSESTDVTISSNGNIAVNATEDVTSEATDAVEPVQPAVSVENEPTSPTETSLAVDDPGIVPSVQPNIPTASTSADTEVARLKEKNKHLKIWLVVLMLLLVGVASALVVYFAQQSKAKSDLKTQQEQNVALQAQLNEQQQTATQQTIDNLNSQLTAAEQKNTELQATIDEQDKQISAYQTAVEKLLVACGDKCSSITVPEDTTETTDNTTN